MHSKKSPPRGYRTGFDQRQDSICAILEGVALLEGSELYSTISNVTAISAGWMTNEIGTMKSGRWRDLQTLRSFRTELLGAMLVWASTRSTVHKGLNILTEKGYILNKRKLHFYAFSDLVKKNCHHSAKKKAKKSAKKCNFLSKKRENLISTHAHSNPKRRRQK